MVADDTRQGCRETPTSAPWRRSRWQPHALLAVRDRFSDAHIEIILAMRKYRGANWVR